MKKETRTVVYDEELKIEAYCFEGIVQSFPNHFHGYYVIGFVEEGKRCLSCRNSDYIVSKGNIVLFNPGENHRCVQIDGSKLDYRGLNISKKIMLDLSEEVTGTQSLPGFSQNVIFNEEAAYYLRSLHDMIMKGSYEFGKEENLLLLLSLLYQQYGMPFESCIPECQEEIEKASHFMEQHYSERVCLDQICQYAGLSKSTLLRAFTKTKGVTPYLYLQNIRIGEAKRLLEQGVPPIEAALQTGFCDQSHFTNYFNSFIGLSPGVYRDIFSGRNQKGDGQHEE